MKALSFDRSHPFRLTDYPEAVAVKAVADPEVVQLQSISLHEYDLAVARDAALEIRLDQDQKAHIIQSFWTCAIALYFKCFGDNASRGRLDSKKVFRGEPPLALEVFDHYKALRNKHIVHDENSYAQGMVAIVVNPPDAPRKIADVLSFAAVAAPSKEDIDNLLRLINKALEWTHGEREKLHKRLAERYEQQNHSDLFALPDLVYTAPVASDVHEKR